MPFRQLVHLVVVSFLFSGCFNAGGCALNALGVKIPDAGNVDDLKFNAIVGDGLAFADGGEDRFGGLTFDVTRDGGAYILQVTTGEGFTQTLVYPNGDDSLVHGTGDIDHDGRTDWVFESSFDPATSKQTSTTLTDMDFDGVFDSRDVWVVDLSTDPMKKAETVSRWRTAADGGISSDADAGLWVDDWSYTGDAIAQYTNPAAELTKTLEGCGLNDNGIDGFPAVEGYTGSLVRLHPPATQIVILNDNEGKGGCTDDQTKILVAAFDAALEDSATCLTISNPDVGRKLKTALVGQRLYVACNDTCPSHLASTDLPYSTGSFLSSMAHANVRARGYQRMNVSPGTPFAHTDIPWMEEILLHELLHFAGIDHDPPGQGFPDGHDLVYAFGRYCSGCQAYQGNPTIGWPGGVRPTAAMYAFDCVDLSDGPHQAVCGAGYLDIPECSKDDCGISGSNCDECCAFTPLNCWANQATQLGRRDVKLVPHVSDACNKTCNGVTVGCCEEHPTEWFDARACGNAGPACADFPVGFCGQ